MRVKVEFECDIYCADSEYDAWLRINDILNSTSMIDFVNRLDVTKVGE